MTPSRSGDDCCPAAKPGACPEDAPAFHEPQPLALEDALAGQLAVNAPPDNAGADVAGAAAGAEDVGVGAAVWVGAAADGVADGWVVGDWVAGGRVGLVLGLPFVAVGAGLPEADTVDVGMLAVVTAVVGELPAVVVTLQPASVPTMRDAPITMRVALRRPPCNRTPITICLHPLGLSQAERLVNASATGWRFGFVRQLLLIR